MSLTAPTTSRAGATLTQSREYCADLTKREARNFYYGLKLLPQRKRAAMFALYAYMRLVDDIADGQDGHTIAQRSEALDVWTEATQSALAGQTTRDAHLLWPAFTEMVHTYSVPHHLFHDVIAGQRQDLDSPVFETFDQLREYCYRVAGVVGLASIYIWGFQGGAATEALAIDRGIAFQLTNILRDLREDAARGRLYLPRNELTSHDITPKSLTDGQTPPGFVPMMHSQLSRAAGFYDRSSTLESLITEDCRPTLRAMTQIYHGILQKMTADPARVLHERVSLSTVTKLRIAWRAARSK
jgi:15-cis-phytoene synthase